MGEEEKQEEEEEGRRRMRRKKRWRGNGGGGKEGEVKEVEEDICCKTNVLSLGGVIESRKRSLPTFCLLCSLVELLDASCI